MPWGIAQKIHSVCTHHNEIAVALPGLLENIQVRIPDDYLDRYSLKGGSRRKVVFEPLPGRLIMTVDRGLREVDVNDMRNGKIRIVFICQHQRSVIRPVRTG